MTTQSAEEAFRLLTLGEPRLLVSVVDPACPAVPRPLDERTQSLLRIGALVALDAPESAYRTAVDTAMRAGADLDDLLAVVAAVAGVVGSARVISCAPRIAIAAGYDAEAALDRLEPPRPR